MGVEFRSFSAQIQESLLREQLMAMLSGAFAILAVLLATLGLYGVIAYMVARRRSEIGVRMALGADRGKVIGLVLRETMILLAAGLLVGGALSYWAGKGAATLLYGLQPYDAVSLISAIVMLAIAGLIASYAPARRAAGLDPMNALREE
jgi:putative ABC transport system permease protein